ncbi:hypothetical protein SAMN04489735_103325 [Aneurinibacillus thermoaerophilus]|uniref:Uncharacterized protein n=1 Tax=Aneurinibacillus thermoaerophilus TaxID=143495 RepID=A0A1G8DHK1_ANETH|nr:hypothetical protein SAMN04489735_103325 [Aneurinibacillus thermoaerophilus]
MLARSTLCYPPYTLFSTATQNPIWNKNMLLLVHLKQMAQGKSPQIPQETHQAPDIDRACLLFDLRKSPHFQTEAELHDERRKIERKLSPLLFHSRFFLSEEIRLHKVYRRCFTSICLQPSENPRFSSWDKRRRCSVSHPWVCLEQPFPV